MIERSGPEEYFALRENSTALLASPLYRFITALIAPYERFQQAPPGSAA